MHLVGFTVETVQYVSMMRIEKLFALFISYLFIYLFIYFCGSEIRSRVSLHNCSTEQVECNEPCFEHKNSYLIRSIEFY